MPNPVGAGLPNTASYDTTSVPGVVKDGVSALWWQQTLDTPNNQGMSCQGGCTATEAVDYCAHLYLGGYCDWRLPTRIELVSIIDFTKASPAINGTAFPNTPATFFWSVSPTIVAGGTNWGVNFTDGQTATNQSSTGRVRCVRTGPPIVH
jgi:hypothetical protein